VVHTPRGHEILANFVHKICGCKATWTMESFIDRTCREIREQVLVSCGLWPLPAKTPLQARVFGKITREGYSVEKVCFQTLPGFYLAGNLYRPLGRGPGPFPGRPSRRCWGKNSARLRSIRTGRSRPGD
jgi:hypothetical protein